MAGRDRPLLLLMRQVAIGYAASRFGSELFGDDVAGFRPGRVTGAATYPIGPPDRSR